MTADDVLAFHALLNAAVAVLAFGLGFIAGYLP